MVVDSSQFGFILRVFNSPDKEVSCADPHLLIKSGFLMPVISAVQIGGSSSCHLADTLLLRSAGGLKNSPPTALGEM